MICYTLLEFDSDSIHQLEHSRLRDRVLLFSESSIASQYDEVCIDTRILECQTESFGMCTSVGVVRVDRVRSSRHGYSLRLSKNGETLRILDSEDSVIIANVGLSERTGISSQSWNIVSIRRSRTVTRFNHECIVSESLGQICDGVGIRL